MTAAEPPEVWLRGPVAGVPPALQPVAHALLQAVEDCERFTGDLPRDKLWISVGGAASVGFHLRHLTGSVDRLLTYARGESLSAQQRSTLASEKEPSADVTAADLLDRLRDTVARALEQLRSTPEPELDHERRVGRAGLPSTIRGLLHHAGEHAIRHAGQISTTVKIVRGANLG